MSCFVHRMRRKEEGSLKLRKCSGSHPGIYHCTGCRLPLFDEARKFDSKTGFPSFWNHIGENVEQNFLTTYGRERTQLLCRQCGKHLGHLFPHKNTPTGVRYCISHASVYQDQDEQPA